MIVVAVFLMLAAQCSQGHCTATLPWGTERIAGYCVWDNNNTRTIDPNARAGQGINISIIDSGVDYLPDENGYPLANSYHEDLAANIKGGWLFKYIDAYGGYVAQYDHDWYNEMINGHGTMVAGIVAATGAGHGGSGILGVAPRANIWCLKYTFYPYNSTWVEKEVVAAINYSSNVLHSQIIVMSFGFYYNPPDLYQACRNAYDHGSLLIAAADDNPPSNMIWPAGYDDCVEAVGATCPNDTRASWSRIGPEIDYVAPGVDINSTYSFWDGPNDYVHNSYSVGSGTSLACPHVAGAAALIWSSKNVSAYDPDGDGWQNYEVNATLRRFALDLGPTGRDDQYGYGLVNAWEPNQRPMGDINADNSTDGSDLILVTHAWGSVPGDPKWDRRADINIDNAVDGSDLIVIARHFGEGDP